MSVRPANRDTSGSLLCSLSLLLLLMMIPAMKPTPLEAFHYGTFPNWFMWGVATASYQIEGAWNTDGKSENIWDRFCHTPGHVVDNETGDIACDSYHRYLEDVALLKTLGVSHYRFSLSWSRIIPDPQTRAVNKLGLQFYKEVLKELLHHGIIPMVTLYHWDLPQVLQDIGGWTNESLIAYFEEFADVCFREFGSLVKYWITFNEPREFIWSGYGSGSDAPGIKKPARDPYIAAHTVLKAHARVWHRYDTIYRQIQKGKVFITLNTEWRTAKDPHNPDDIAAGERAMQFSLGWFAHPIYVDGDYPQVMKKFVAEKSKMEGLNVSRLPEFTDSEKKFIKGTSDLFGLNHYTTQLAETMDTGISNPGWMTDQNVKLSINSSWHGSGSSWLYVVPWGFRQLVKWVKDEYTNPDIFITENGVSDNSGTLNDSARIHYFQLYIDELLKAIDLDGCHVLGYTAWSLMDNFEWSQGISEKFGLAYIDFSDPVRKRSPKDSFAYFSQIIRNNGFPKL